MIHNNEKILLNVTITEFKMKTLYLLRGVPSSGKTSLAKTLEQYLPNVIAFAADDYHYDDLGNYNWKPENIHKAHTWCQSSVSLAMYEGKDNIIVHNTNTTEKELKPYKDMTSQHGYRIVSLVVEKRHDNKNNHNVPEDTIEKMELRLRDSMKLK